MDFRKLALVAGPLGLLATLILAAPAGMPATAWHTAGLVRCMAVWWMAVWWMTEAMPLSATAMLPFIRMEAPRGL